MQVLRQHHRISSIDVEFRLRVDTNTNRSFLQARDIIETYISTFPTTANHNDVVTALLVLLDPFHLHKGAVLGMQAVVRDVEVVRQLAHALPGIAR